MKRPGRRFIFSIAGVLLAAAARSTAASEKMNLRPGLFMTRLRGWSIQETTQLALGSLVGGAAGFGSGFNADGFLELALGIDEFNDRCAPFGTVGL